MPDAIFECPKCGRRWQCSPFHLRYYGQPGQHTPSDPDVALVVADGPICDGRPVPRGEATGLGDNPSKEEVAEYLRHHQTMPDHLVRPPRGEATESRDESR